MEDIIENHDDEQLRRLFLQGLAILDRRRAASFSGRNPDHFGADGIRLSPAGIDALYALFEQGMTNEAAARTIGIATKSAENRRKMWQNSKR